MSTELIKAEKFNIFGNLPPVSFFGRNYLITVKATAEPISIQFAEKVNYLRNNACLRLVIDWANKEKHPDENPSKSQEI